MPSLKKEGNRPNMDSVGLQADEESGSVGGSRTDTGRPPAPRTRPARMLRILSLLALWGLMTYVTVRHQQRGGGPDGVPTVHALCPFGGIATVYRCLSDDTFIKRTFPSSLILFGGTVLLALVLRRTFCGWICPLGAMQELFAAIGRRLRWRRALHASRLDAGLRWGKYAVLAAVLLFTYMTGELVFAPYDPWAAYAHLTAGWGELRGEFLVGAILLLVTVVGSVSVDRGWCRYLCPMGGLLALISRAGATRIVRDEQTCVHCRRCDKARPVDISIEAMDQVVTGECLACGECVEVCPAEGALQFRAGGRTVSVLSVGIATLVIFFGVVIATRGAGVWRALPSSMAEITEHGGGLSAANIRGFMSLQEIQESYGVAASDVIDDLSLPQDTDRMTPVKDVMAPLGREVEEIREVVAERMAQGAGPPASGEVDAAPDPSSSEIKGTMTLAQVEEMFGVSASDLVASLDLPADTETDRPLKEIMKPLGREVAEVRDAVARLSE